MTDLQSRSSYVVEQDIDLVHTSVVLTVQLVGLGDGLGIEC